MLSASAPSPDGYGRYVLARDAGATGRVAAVLAVVMRSLTRGLGYGLLTCFVAIYLAAQPDRHRRLSLRLIPAGYRTRAEYPGIHFVEGNFITPLVQAEASSLPPVLSLLSFVAFSALFGSVALPLAVPLCLFLMSRG